MQKARFLLACATGCAMVGGSGAARCASGPAAEVGRSGGRRTMLVINEDNSHFFGARAAEEMTLEGLRAFVDQYADSAVTHLFLCPNAMRASFRSRSRDAIWDPVSGRAPDEPWPRNAKRLFESGLDPYAVWIARAREQGISPWLSMRMNDVHSVDEPDNFMHSSFWREHPEFWRVPSGSASPWVNRAMNYAHPEVREHHLGLIRELLERYDPDGLELDWMRFGYHLTPGREREEGCVLGEFVRAVRTLTREWAEKRGHRILLGVRVPADPDAAAGLGMDAVAWAGAGLVDMIVPCPFWASSDFDIPVELWRGRLGAAAAQVMVVPGIEHNARPWPGGAAVANDLAALRGFAASAYDRGADGLYLFNWMDSETRPVTAEEYGRLVRDGLAPRAVLAVARRHPVCYRDTVPDGFPTGAQLPVAARAGGTFRLHIGPRPRAGRVWAVIGLDGTSAPGIPPLAAQLNGRDLGAAEALADVTGLGGGAVEAARFACPLDAVQAGYNELHVCQAGDAGGWQIVWVELRIEPPPTVRQVSRIVGEEYLSETVRIGDLSGDGAPDLLFVQNLYGPRIIACVTATTIAGEILWQSGTPSRDNGRCYCDLPVQIYDWDGDGQNEVLYVRQAVYADSPGPDPRAVRERAARYQGDAAMVILDGCTGAEEGTLALPAPADDSFLFADLTGRGRREDLVVKDRYWNMWGVAHEGGVLWHYAGSVGHYPAIADLDGDGRDEVFVGFALIDHDGTVLFERDSGGAHQDAAFVIRPEDGRWRLLFGNGGIHCLARDGAPLWEHPLGEAQHVVAGRFRSEPQLQFVVVDRTPVPTHRRDDRAWAILYQYDLDGRELWRRRMQPGEWCIATRLIRWHGIDQPDCVLVYGFSVDRRGPGKAARIYNGDGEVIDELPLEVGPAPGESEYISDCYGMAADVWGDSREEALLFGSRGFCIYANARPLAEPALYNMTLYPGM